MDTEGVSDNRLPFRSLSEIAEILSLPVKNIGPFYFWHLEPTQQSSVLLALDDEPRRKVVSEILLAGIGEKWPSRLSNRPNRARLADQQNQIFEIGATRQISAHGVEEDKGGINNLLLIMIEGKVRSFYAGPLTSGDPSWAAGPHGPFYVIADFRSLEWQDRANHQCYLVPEESDKQFIQSALEMVVANGVRSAADASICLQRTMTYDEFIQDSASVNSSSESLHRSQ